MLTDLQIVQFIAVGFIAAFVLLFPLYLIESIRCERWRKRYLDSKAPPTSRPAVRPNPKGID